MDDLLKSTDEVRGEFDAAERCDRCDAAVVEVIATFRAALESKFLSKDSAARHLVDRLLEASEATHQEGRQATPPYPSALRLKRFSRAVNLLTDSLLRAFAQAHATFSVDAGHLLDSKNFGFMMRRSAAGGWVCEPERPSDVGALLARLCTLRARAARKCIANAIDDFEVQLRESPQYLDASEEHTLQVRKLLADGAAHAALYTEACDLLEAHPRKQL